MVSYVWLVHFIHTDDALLGSMFSRHLVILVLYYNFPILPELILFVIFLQVYADYIYSHIFWKKRPGTILIAFKKNLFLAPVFWFISSVLFWFFSLPAPHGVACSRSMAAHSRCLTTPPVSPPSATVHRNYPPTTGRLSSHRASVPCVSMATVVPSPLSHSPFVRSSFVLPEESAADYTTEVSSSPIKTTVTLIRRSSDSDIDVPPKGTLFLDELVFHAVWYSQWKYSLL